LIAARLIGRPATSPHARRQVAADADKDEGNRQAAEHPAPIIPQDAKVEQQRLNGRRAVDLPLQGNLHLKIRAVALFLIDPGVLSACVFTDRATDERYIHVTYNDF
jgi:hypothetical protein